MSSPAYLPHLGLHPFEVLAQAVNSRIAEIPDRLQGAVLETLKDLKYCTEKFYSSEKYKPQVANIVSDLSTLRRLIMSSKIEDTKDILDEINALYKEHFDINRTMR